MKGSRLDWCYEWGLECGQKAVNAFCQKMGYKKTIDCELDNDIGEKSPTKCIHDGRICNKKFCNGFEYIECEK